MDSITENILYQNEILIAINKPQGMPVQSDKTGDIDLWSEVKKHVQEELFLVNRLDRPVSGVVIFGKSKKAYNDLKKLWNDKELEKQYIAICEGQWKENSVILQNTIKKGRNNKAIIHQEGKVARLQLDANPIFDNYSLCKIKLLTGRFHQIRFQLSHSGHPIKGDVKYGARRKNNDRSIHLHCFKISLKDKWSIIAPLPDKDNLWKQAADYLNKLDY